MVEEYYRKEAKDIIHTLDSSLEGLMPSEVSARLKKYGPNQIAKADKFSLIRLILDQFKDIMIIILCVSVFISFILGEISDAIVIGAIVLLNAIIGFTQEYKAEKSLEALRSMISPNTFVMRNGKVEEISVKDVVPGDILVLEEGYKVPADARLLETVNMKVDESTLTGESFTIDKKVDTLKKSNLALGDQKNMVFMGTTVTNGRGKAIVIGTGNATEFGKIAKLTTASDSEMSPLQKELDFVAKFLAKFALVICVIVFVLGVSTQWGTKSWEVLLFEMFLYAIALAIAIVPEGLPATVTISLSIGVQRMLKKKALIKKLASVETLGCTTVICSDKTGTLTKNEMTVSKVYFGDRVYEVTGEGYAVNGEVKGNTDAMDLFLKGCVLCNNSAFNSKEDMRGDPTEIALTILGKKAGFDKEYLDKSYKRLHENPFDSDRKMMSIVSEMEGKKIVFVKGAPNEVLKRCKKRYHKGKAVALTASQKEAMLEINHDMAEDALRVLAIAYKEVKTLGKKDAKSMEKELVFLGLAGMMDPPRDDTLDSIALCKKSGIRVVMITGDQQNTATAIARQIGLIAKKEMPVVITGAELKEMNDEKLMTKIHDVKIFARVSPEDKIRIVDLLKKDGQVVAMSGDGVNDAPALKKSDIGVAMGSGTDVSKEASDMILLDDSFSVIVSAVKEGRSIYDNVKKFILYVFSGIGAELFAVLISVFSFSAIPLPITAVQILWIDLGTEVFPAISLGVDPPAKDIMDRKPRSPGERIMKKGMMLRILRNAGYITFGVMVMFLWTINSGVGGSDYALRKARTLVFTAIIVAQMFNAFNCRSEKVSIFKMKFFSNKPLLLAVSISLIMQVFMVHLPYLNILFETVPLTLMEWGIIYAFGASTIVWIEVWKWFARRNDMTPSLT